MIEPISFFVAGKAEPAGSKRSFIYKRKGMAGTDRKHFGASTSDANPKSAGWKDTVRFEAMRAYTGDPLIGPLQLDVTFTLLRPKSHYRSGKNAHLLKDDAPKYPTSKPDTTKLIRGIEDALTSITWIDDAQIVNQHGFKRYGLRQGATIEIAPADE